MGLHIVRGGCSRIMKTCHKLETVPWKVCHIHLLGPLKLCSICCPVDLVKPEVSTDPARWFNVHAPSVEMAAQSKQASWEQVWMSHIRCAVDAHI